MSAGTLGPPRLRADRRSGTGIPQVRGYRRGRGLDRVLSAGLAVEQHDVHRRALRRLLRLMTDMSVSAARSRPADVEVTEYGPVPRDEVKADLGLV